MIITSVNNIYRNKEILNKGNLQHLKQTAEFQPAVKFNNIPDLKSYTLTFLGSKNYTINERAFMNFRKALSTRLNKLQISANEARWNFLVNSNDQTRDILSQEYDKISEFFQNEDYYARLLQFKKQGIHEPVLKKHLDYLINAFERNINCRSELKAISDKKYQVSQKFAEYKANYKGKDYTYSELDKLVSKQKTAKKRNKIRVLKVSRGDYIKDDLIELVKVRNNFARKLGYKNYFEYSLSENNNIDKQELLNLLNELENRFLDINKKAEKTHKFRLYKEAGNFIKSPEEVFLLSAKMYKQMGWDLEKLPVKYDLYPRENKRHTAVCLRNNIPSDTRVLTNITGKFDDIRSISHENGHAVYNMEVSDRLPYLDRKPASMDLTEAVAILMQTLPVREKEFLKDQLNMPDKLLVKLETSRKQKLVKDICRYLKMIHFEKALYENPDQDLRSLWNDLCLKYENKTLPHRKINQWANISHFITNPASSVHYLRAHLMACQIYKAMTNKIGNLTETTDTRDYLRNNLFKYGSSLSEDELMIKLTGSPLKIDPLLEEIKDLF